MVQFSALEVSFIRVLTHELHGWGQRGFLCNRPLSRALYSSSHHCLLSALWSVSSNPWLLRGRFPVRLIQLMLRTGLRWHDKRWWQSLPRLGDFIQREAPLWPLCLPPALIATCGRVQSSSHKWRMEFLSFAQTALGQIRFTGILKCNVIMCWKRINS